VPRSSPIRKKLDFPGRLLCQLPVVGSNLWAKNSYLFRPLGTCLDCLCIVRFFSHAFTQATTEISAAPVSAGRGQSNREYIEWGRTRQTAASLNAHGGLQFPHFALLE
jgi:hypothetical protein